MDTNEKMFWKKVYLLVGEDIYQFGSKYGNLSQEYSDKNYSLYILMQLKYLLPIYVKGRIGKLMITDKFRKEILN